MEACDSENGWDVLATSAILEYLEESYESEEEWDMTDSSLFKSAPLEEEIQEQMNSSNEVENISPSVVMEKEDVKEFECKEENEIVHNMGEQLEEKQENPKAIKELLWSFNDEEFEDEALMIQEK